MDRRLHWKGWVLDRNGANPRPLSGGGLTGGRSLCCLVAGPTRDCSWFVVGDGDGRLWFGDEGSGKVALLASEGAHYHFGAVKHLAANPDGTLLASAAADRIVLLWDIPNRRLLDAYEAGDIVTAVAWLSAECLAVGLGHGNAAFLRLCRGSAPAAASSLTPLTS